jgi:cation transport ATPase
VIFPHEVCPVDGEVVEGNGYMDESFLTGTQERGFVVVVKFSLLRVFGCLALSFLFFILSHTLGESLLVDKACGSPVISGAYNGGGAITIKGVCFC